MVEIRMYQDKDHDKIVELIHEFYKNSLNQYSLTFDKEEGLKRLQGLIRQLRNTSFILIVDGEVRGIMGGFIVEELLSPTKVYQEVIWYVSEEHRRHGIKLLRRLEKWCIDHGIDKIIMAFMHNSMPDRLLRFYERTGYSQFETHLIKDLNHDRAKKDHKEFH